MPKRRPEPLTTSGEPLLSHNHVLLLQALLDRPGGRVRSYNEWFEAVLPLARGLRPRVSEWCLRSSMRTLHPAWAARRRHGSRLEVELTARGRWILERRIPARVRGYGPYRGMATLRRNASPGAADAAG
jgi:hypothetical protein